jgi:hypothetical protein
MSTQLEASFHNRRGKQKGAPRGLDITHQLLHILQAQDCIDGKVEEC